MTITAISDHEIELSVGVEVQSPQPTDRLIEVGALLEPMAQMRKHIQSYAEDGYTPTTEIQLDLETSELCVTLIKD